MHSQQQNKLPAMNAMPPHSSLSSKTTLGRDLHYRKLQQHFDNGGEVVFFDMEAGSDEYAENVMALLKKGHWRG